MRNIRPALSSLLVLTMAACVLAILGAASPAAADHPRVSVFVGLPPIVISARGVVVIPGAPAYDEYQYFDDHYHDHGDSDSDSDSDHRHGRHCRHR